MFIYNTVYLISTLSFTFLFLLLFLLSLFLYLFFLFLLPFSLLLIPFLLLSIFFCPQMSFVWVNKIVHSTVTPTVWPKTVFMSIWHLFWKGWKKIRKWKWPTNRQTSQGWTGFIRGMSWSFFPCPVGLYQPPSSIQPMGKRHHTTFNMEAPKARQGKQK